MPVIASIKYQCCALLCLLAFFLSSPGAEETGAGLSANDTSYYSLSDFYAVQKFDAHVHLNTYENHYIDGAQSDNFSFLDIVVDRPFGLPMVEQEKIARVKIKAFPGRVFYATTFPVKNYKSRNWQQETIATIKDAILHGAVAVKIWKNIGMDLKDRDGKFVMINNPKLDPVLDYLEKNKIPLIAHLAEPKECWLPLEQMVLHKNYYSQHPEYHMYLHPEYPSYEAHMKARDQMLQKHSGLIFINAHLGSLEWNLDEIAQRLDRFPNMAVDLARMNHLYLHAKNDSRKTRDFFIKYQDRLLYATDVQVGGTRDPTAMKNNAHENKMRHWKFFVTDAEMNEPIIGEFKGLKLPREVIRKIYRENAERWLPGIKG